MGEDVNLTQNYGMSELMGPGVSGECLKLNGMHINEDHFIAEIIDSATGEVLPPGEKGELVITCISKERCLSSATVPGILPGLCMSRVPAAAPRPGWRTCPDVRMIC